MAIRCGNHGRDRVYHATVADVRACATESAEIELEIAEAIASEKRYYQHLETHNDHRAQEAHDTQNGVDW